jgi:hypothetical protein
MSAPPPGADHAEGHRGRARVIALALVIIGLATAAPLLLRGEPPLPLGLLRLEPAGPARPPELPPLWEHFSSLIVVEQLTGPGSPNRTYERWNVGGTDLGHTFYHEGSLYMVFGDTYGRENGDWRSNTMARIADLDSPESGIDFEDFITDESGRARELLSSRKVYWVERTVIPTNGTSVGERMYLHYMSVQRWIGSGRWRINHAGLAYSDDDGHTWTKTGPLWGEFTNFAQVAFVRDTVESDYVYLFGIPSGRFGGVRIARVPEEGLLDVRRYTYWDGSDWSPREADATTVVSGPVGELSVVWNEFLDQWLMMYLSEPLHAIVVRTADSLTGPWSDERLITTARDHPQLYAPFIIPFPSDEPDVFFTMSRWDSYNVFLMQLEMQ